MVEHGVFMNYMLPIIGLENDSQTLPRERASDARIDNIVCLVINQVEDIDLTQFENITNQDLWDLAKEHMHLCFD